MVERLCVGTDLFDVATEGSQRERFGVAIGNFMLRHSRPSWEDFLSRLNSFMSRQSWIE